MGMQPGLTPLPAFGKAVERELDPEADQYADVDGTDEERPEAQHINEEALDAFIARDQGRDVEGSPDGAPPVEAERSADRN